MKVKELKAILEKVKPGLANKEIIEQATCFAFLGDQVATFNDKISISCPLETKFQGAVDASALYALVTKLPGKKRVHLEEENDQLILKAGKAKAGLPLQEITLPLEEVEEIKTWEAVPCDFTYGIDFVLSSCSRDMSREVLTCVYIEPGKFTGADGYRITEYVCDDQWGLPAFLLPAEVAKELAKYTLIGMAPSTEGNWTHFKTKDGVVISCRTYQRKDYPSTETWLDMGDGTEIELPLELIEIVERAEVVAKSDFYLDERLNVAKKGKKIIVKAQNNTGRGWFKEWIKTKVDVEDFSFNIHPAMFKQLLRLSLNCIVMEDRIGFNGDNWNHVTVLWKD